MFVANNAFYAYKLLIVVIIIMEHAGDSFAVGFHRQRRGHGKMANRTNSSDFLVHEGQIDSDFDFALVIGVKLQVRVGLVLHGVFRFRQIERKFDLRYKRTIFSA